MTFPLGDDTEFTQLVDADVPRVDLVSRAANGSPGFLLMKQDARGLMDPDAIRDLIGKQAGPGPTPQRQETVTMTGSPGAIMKLIHEASQHRAADADGVTKAKYSAADRKRMAGHEAMADGSYPVADRADLDRAIHAVGRGGADHDAIRRHVITRAKAIGGSGEIPDNWAADGSLKEVSKMVGGDMDEGIDGMDPTVVLAGPDSDDAPGDSNTPGSPAWEAVDAATARKWTSILSRAKTALGVMSDREMLEAATVDPDDACNAMELDDAACAIDYAISVLAPFAIDEQAEADCGDEMAAVGKALAGFDPGTLDTIEALDLVAKAGRSLSAANEQAIRGAVESLTKVLASLPAPDDSGQSVAKETAMADTEATNTETDEPVEKTTEATAEDVVKAKGDPQMVVYDQKGRLIGIVDPGDVTPVANSDADAGDDTQNSDDDDTATDTTDAPPAAAPADLTPAPAAEVGTPADAAPSDDDVTKASEQPATENDSTADSLSEMLKSSLRAAVEDVMAKQSAAQTEQIAKTGDAVLELAELVKAQQDRIRVLEEQPAVPKVFTNGAVPPRDMLRGQDQGAPPIDMAKAQQMKKGLYGAADATEQNRIATDMQTAAIARLQEIHQRRAQ